VLDTITQERNKRDVFRGAVGEDPIRLRHEHLGAAPIGARHVILRVRERDDGEIRPRRRPRRPAKDCDDVRRGDILERDAQLCGGSHGASAVHRAQRRNDDRPGAANEFKIETYIRTVSAGLVDFHRKKISANGKISRGNGRRIESAFVGAANVGRCAGPITDRAAGHVAAKDFTTIEINHRAIVAEEQNPDIRVERRVRHIESVAKIGGDIFIGRNRAVADHGGFAAIAVAELGSIRRPEGVIEAGIAPRRTLIGAVIEVFPNCSRRNEDRRASRLRERQGQKNCCNCCLRGSRLVFGGSLYSHGDQFVAMKALLSQK